MSDAFGAASLAVDELPLRLLLVMGLSVGQVTARLLMRMDKLARAGCDCLGRPVLRCAQHQGCLGLSVLLVCSLRAAFLHVGALVSVLTAVDRAVLVFVARDALVGCCLDHTCRF